MSPYAKKLSVMKSHAQALEEFLENFASEIEGSEAHQAVIEARDFAETASLRIYRAEAVLNSELQDNRQQPLLMSVKS